MSGLRQKIAQRLVEAQHTAAILTTFNEADMSKVMELRAKYKDSFKTKHGVALGFSSFFIKATIEALKAFPNVNGRIEGTDIVTNHAYDIGVAVSTERGLMVPVIRDADKLSFAGIEKAIGAYAPRPERGRSRSPTSRAGRSRSPTAASSARCSRRRSSTRPRAASSGCTRSRSGRSPSTTRSSSGR